jgi:hypothetical protein
MQSFRADLHVHTVLSPCAGVEMIPPLIVQTALEKGITLIAITDHNTSANIAPVMEAAKDTGLTVLPGMELQTKEEVHMLCLFDTLEQVQAWQKTVDASLPSMFNNVEYFGDQFVVDATGDFIRREERLLITSINLSLEEAAEGVRALGGLPIPAHVDRKAYGLIANLGLIPPGFEGLELSRFITPNEAQRIYPQLGTHPLIQSGDVHHLDGFLGTLQLMLEQVSVAEITMALRGQDGRSAIILPT